MRFKILGKDKTLHLLKLERKQETEKRSEIRITLYFIIAMQEARRQWKNAFKILK